MLSVHPGVYQFSIRRDGVYNQKPFCVHPGVKKKKSIRIFNAIWITNTYHLFLLPFREVQHPVPLHVVRSLFGRPVLRLVGHTGGAIAARPVHVDFCGAHVFQHRVRGAVQKPHVHDSNRIVVDRLHLVGRPGVGLIVQGVAAATFVYIL